jgi:hypothetical protein
VDQRTRPEVLKRDEQIKAVSTLLTNFGSALSAAGAARWALQAFDEQVVLWLRFGAALIWTGVKSLTMLEAEG